MGRVNFLTNSKSERRPLRLEVVLVKDSNSNLGREGRDLRWKKVREVKVRSLTGRNVNHGRTALRRELPRLPQSFALLSSYAGALVPGPPVVIFNLPGFLLLLLLTHRFNFQEPASWLTRRFCATARSEI